MVEEISPAFARWARQKIGLAGIAHRPLTMATIKSTVEMCQNQDTMEQQESELLELTSGTMSESKESMEEQENSVEEPTVILAVRIDDVCFECQSALLGYLF